MLILWRWQENHYELYLNFLFASAENSERMATFILFSLTRFKICSWQKEFTFVLLDVVNNLLGMGFQLPADVGLLTIMRILFPMPPEQQSVIKRATENGGIISANLGNIEGQIKQGKTWISNLTRVQYWYHLNLESNLFQPTSASTWIGQWSTVFYWRFSFGCKSQTFRFSTKINLIELNSHASSFGCSSP